MKQQFLKWAKRFGLFALARRMTAGKLRILCYHGAWIAEGPVYGSYLFMDPESFARRMALVKSLGYPVLPLDGAVEKLRNGTLPPGATAITIDDGWYSTFAHMLPVLKSKQMPATVYVTTHYVVKERPVLNILVGHMLDRAAPGPYNWPEIAPGAGDGEIRLDGPAGRTAVAERIWERLDALPDVESRYDEVRRLSALFGYDLARAEAERWFDLMRAEELRAAHNDGFDIQLHTHRHRQYGFNADRVASEITENRQQLAGILGLSGESFTRFCYPSGNWSETLFPVLRRLGIDQATTTDPGLNARDAEPLALRRILDGEGLSDLDFEARLCGFWDLVEALKSALARDRGHKAQDTRQEPA